MKNAEFSKGGWKSCSILAVSGPKFMKFWDYVGNPSEFPTPFPDCLHHVPACCHWVAKSSKIGRSFSAPIFLAMWRTQKFFSSLLSWFTPTVWQSLVEFCSLKCVCEVRLWRKMQNFRRVDKNDGDVWNHLWTKVHVVSRPYRRPLLVANALPRLSILYSISCSSPEILALNVAIELRSRR